MKLFDFFEKGYYINLDRRVDRDEVFRKEMAQLGLLDHLERVSAEDGTHEEEIIKRHHYCGYTYYKLFQKVYEEGYEKVIVFEDDAYFFNGWDVQGIDLVERALDELQEFPDWDIFYLGGCPLEPITPVSKTLCSATRMLNTHAVGYKRTVIKHVIDKYIPFGDSFIDSWYAAFPELKKYIVNPIAVPQRSSASDLDAFNHKANIGTYLSGYQTHLVKNEIIQ